MSICKFVFFNAKDGKVELSVNRNVVGSANNSAELVDLLQKAEVTLDDNMSHSSSVDFATEYGFSDDNGAYRIIEPALDRLYG